MLKTYLALGGLLLVIFLGVFYLNIGGVERLDKKESIETTTQTEIEAESESELSQGTSTDRHPSLTPAQENALLTIGIDPAKLPSELTPDIKMCFEEKIGVQRVDEIINGSLPTAAEFVAGKACLGL